MKIKGYKGVKTSGFIKNAFTSVTGSSISQAVPILSAPILSRIYSPEDYGRIGIYMAVAVIIGTISNFQYSNALLLPKEERHFKALIKLCIRNSFITAASAAVFFLLLYNYLAKLLDAEAIKYYFFLLPFSMFMIGIQNTFIGFSNRKKLYKALAKNRILSTVLTVIFSISLGIVFNHWTGLLVGYLVGQIVNSLGLYLRIKREIAEDYLSDVSKDELLEVRKNFISFPKFGMTTELLNNFTYQIPVFLLNIFVGPHIVGAYNMCNRLLALPSTIISSAVGEVFKQRAAEDLHSKGTCAPIYSKTFKSLSILSIIPFLIIIIFGPQLFTFFLGEKWKQAGEFARILSPIYFLRFINSPLSFIIYLFKKLRFDLYVTVYLNITSFLILFFALQYFSVTEALLCFSLNFCLIYTYMIRYSFNLSKNQYAI